MEAPNARNVVIIAGSGDEKRRSEGFGSWQMLSKSTSSNCFGSKSPVASPARLSNVEFDPLGS
jgi:hypothetical protein